MYIPKVLLVFVVSFTLTAFAVLGYFSITAFERSNGSIVQNCEEIELVKSALRETIEQSKRFVQSSKVRSPTEKKASEEYYAEVLDKFHERKCSTPLPQRKLPHARIVPRKTHSQQRDKAVLGNQRVLRFHRFGGDSGSGLASHP